MCIRDSYHFVLQKTDIRASDEKVVEIEMERLRTFTNHPFKVIGDSQMIELQDSIKTVSYTHLDVYKRQNWGFDSP